MQYMNNDDETYTGETKKGKRHGYGRCVNADGSCYTGNWSEGKRHGQGHVEDPSGISWMGRFTKGEYGNFGTLFPAPGNKEQVLTSGQFTNGSFNGLGLVLNENSGPSYAGQLKGSKMTGSGCWYHPDGRIVAGQGSDSDGEAVTLELYPDGRHAVKHWRDGLQHGETVIWEPDGTMSLYRYTEGELLDPVTIYKPDGVIITGLMDNKGFQGEILFIHNGGYNVRKNYRDGKP